MASLESTDMNLSRHWETVKGREAQGCSPWALANSRAHCVINNDTRVEYFLALKRKEIQHRLHHD